MIQSCNLGVRHQPVDRKDPLQVELRANLLDYEDRIVQSKNPQPDPKFLVAQLQTFHPVKKN